MSNEFSKRIESILYQEKLLLHNEKKEYRYIRGGKLVSRYNNGQICFSEKVADTEIGITRDKERVQALARKRYLASSIPQREAACKELQALLKKPAFSANKRLSNMHASKIQELQRARFTAAVNNWLDEPSKGNDKHPETLIFVTNCGIKVRSKSELIIANKLTEYGLAFKYEPAIILEGITYHPDFVIRRWDNSDVLWEHFGRMDLADYARLAADKISAYQRAGYRTHSNLICTYESDINKPRGLETIIERFLL